MACHAWSTLNTVVGPIRVKHIKSISTALQSKRKKRENKKKPARGWQGWECWGTDLTVGVVNTLKVKVKGGRLCHCWSSF